MTIDPRLLERRKAVAEDHAARNIGRLLRFLAFIIIAGLVVWAVFSPWLSVSQVRTAGVVVSDANAVLAEHGVVAGTPLVMLRPGTVEEALIADPWVREARVHIDWPDEVIVRVVERAPVAWFHTAGGWARRDVSGVALPGPSSPDDELPWVRVSGLDDVDAPGSDVILGTAEFSASLPRRLQAGTTLWVEEGEVWANVAGYDVRLGRPTEMEAKALSLVALLEQQIEPGSTLILVAPTHPAVSPPNQPPGDGETDETVGDEQP